MSLCSIVYFLSIAGIPYDISMSSPPFGLEMDESGRFSKPIAFMQWEINHQYILEGLFAATFVIIGAFVMKVDKEKAWSRCRGQQILRRGATISGEDSDSIHILKFESSRFFGLAPAPMTSLTEEEPYVWGSESCKKGFGRMNLKNEFGEIKRYFSMP
ncbi:unnamed protein product [Lepeophtheirus salmonis]|uniref:(salmon louse) hypothetical protein n=1 Tax=Lepeophtheirus salmonis TaxID=72036 RepID=A0A7R8CY98_LEPSM|nr:unnamed protein product [Lepeophtheirus salmonis]CAF2967788.1 unnamed protein product [Lepeophtheirus salmonis]